MAGSWTTSASSLTDLEDDALLLHSPGFDDDDPSSYLLYPPGFGPVEYGLALTPSPGREHPTALLPAGETGAGLLDDPVGAGLQGEGLGLAGSTRSEVELGEVPGGLQVGEPPSGAPSGQFCFVGTADCDGIFMFSGVPHCGGGGGGGGGDGNGVDEYVVSGNSGEKRDVEARVLISHDADVDSLGCSVTSMCRESATAREDAIGGREAPVLPTRIKVEAGNGGETDSRCSGYSNGERGGSSSSLSSSSSSLSLSSSSPPPPLIGEQNGEAEGGDFRGDDGYEGDGDGGKGEKTDEVADLLEEGEIRTPDAEVVVVATSTHGDEVAATKESTRSINELQVLPPVPSRKHTLEPHQHTLPVGVISSIIGNKVTVEGIQKHNPLSKGSILWIIKTGTPLGPVDEIFGAGKNPSYVVRYKSEEEVPAGISEGAAVSFVIFGDPKHYKERYDASDQNKGGTSDEIKFSYYEKEAEVMRCLQQPKRRTETRRQINEESLMKKSSQFDERRAQVNTFGLRKDAHPSAPRASTPVRQPPHFPSHLQAPPHVPRWMQAPPRAPHIPGHLQEPPWQPCLQGQLQAQAPSPLHWFPGNNNGDNLPCFLGDGQVCLAGLPVVHSVPHGGQSGGPFGAEQPNLLTQEPYAAWAYGSHQQLGLGLPIMLPVNRMPCQHPQGLHAFHQHHNQAFQHFTNGTPLQYHCSPNQGMPHDVSCRQGALPSPPAPLRCWASTSHGGFVQAPSGHMSACEGGIGLPNGNQNLAQFQSAMGQGDVQHPPLKLTSPNFPASGRPPYGHDGGFPYGRNGCPRTGS